MNQNTLLTIYHDFFIAASITEVFNAISQPKHLVNWWPSKCTGKPKLNETYNFYFTPKYDWYGKVSKFKTNESFYIKMTKSIESWNPTTFGFDLLEENDTVRVKFQHYGWSQLTEEYKVTSYCWAMLLNGLKNYVEKEIIIPFEKRS